MATNLKKISKVVQTCRQAAGHYDTVWPRVLTRVVRLKFRERFRPKESFLWGLADPRLPQAEIDKVVSRSRLYRLQAVHNPMSLSYLTEDKAVFYSYCSGAGIEVPTLHAIYQPSGGWACGTTSEARTIAGRDDWTRYFESEAPRSFVIKPSKGVYARGLMVLTRSEDGKELVSSSGRSRDVSEILDEMSADSRYDTYIVQDKLENHAELQAMSGSKALQTVRVVTMVDADRRPRCLFACAKVINSEQLSDNFDYGTSGNLLADVDLDTGRLRNVMGKHESGFGLQEHEAHPKTGVVFSDVTLPFWPETRRLAEEAALKFLPLRTIGWDIAITAEGPSVVEGNVWWDALHNAHRLMPEYLATF